MRNSTVPYLSQLNLKPNRCLCIQIGCCIVPTPTGRRVAAAAFPCGSSRQTYERPKVGIKTPSSVAEVIPVATGQLSLSLRGNRFPRNKEEYPCDPPEIWCLRTWDLLLSSSLAFPPEDPNRPHSKGVPLKETGWAVPVGTIFLSLHDALA